MWHVIYCEPLFPIHQATYLLKKTRFLCLLTFVHRRLWNRGSFCLFCVLHGFLICYFAHWVSSLCSSLLYCSVYPINVTLFSLRFILKPCSHSSIARYFLLQTLFCFYSDINIYSNFVINYLYVDYTDFPSPFLSGLMLLFSTHFDVKVTVLSYYLIWYLFPLQESVFWWFKSSFSLYCFIFTVCLNLFVKVYSSATHEYLCIMQWKLEIAQ